MLSIKIDYSFNLLYKGGKYYVSSLFNKVCNRWKEICGLMDSNECIWSCVVFLEESKRIIIDIIKYKKNVLKSLNFNIY